MRDIFILVPSMHPTGPVKGAVALANALVGLRGVTLVSLKDGPGPDAVLNTGVRHICLSKAGKWYRRVGAYRKLLVAAGGRASVASISLCLSADMANLFCRGEGVTCSSVRGNLPQNYRHDYGPIGGTLARAHLLSLRGMDHVVAMNSVMSRQITTYISRPPVVIGNFVDELALEPYRFTGKLGGPLRFVFLASLTSRKRPELLIDAFASLIAAGVDAQLDIIGEGRLKGMVNDLIQGRGFANLITLHGHLRDPYPLLGQADAMVLPSISEGTSRAGLEALHLGVPCVLRDADGNAELVCNGVNGALFHDDAELPAAMLAAARLSRDARARDSLLPDTCRQRISAARYLELVEST